MMAGGLVHRCRHGVAAAAFMARHLDPGAIWALLIGVTGGGARCFLDGLRVGVGVGIRARAVGERRRGKGSQNGDRTDEDRWRDPHGKFSAHGLKSAPLIKNNLAIFGQRGARKTFGEMAWLTKRKRRRHGRRLQGGLYQPGRNSEPLVAVFGVPFGAGPAHVVTLGPIGIARHPEQALPTTDERTEAMAKRKRGEHRDQHDASQWDLPRTETNGMAKISSPKSSLACSVQPRQSSPDGSITSERTTFVACSIASVRLPAGANRRSIQTPASLEQ